MVDIRTFFSACRGGRLEDVRHCTAQAGDQAGKLLMANHCQAFRKACKRGYTDIVRHLLEVAGEVGGKELQRELLTSAHCGAFGKACRSHRPDTAAYLLHQAQEIGSLPLVGQLLSAIVTEERMRVGAPMQEAVGTTIGAMLEPYARKGTESLRDALDCIPGPVRAQLPNRRRLAIAAERKDAAVEGGSVGRA